MKKSKRILSLLCACCMILSSMLCSASAAEERTLHDGEDLQAISAYAGKTIPLTVVVVDPETGMQNAFDTEVAIPKGATNQMKHDLLVDAAKAVEENAYAATRSMGTGDELIYEETALSLTTSPKTVCYERLRNEYNRLYVEFEAVRGLASSITVTVHTDSTVGTVSVTAPIRPSNVYAHVLMVYGNRYGSGTFYMHKNEYLRVTASTDVTGALCNLFVSADLAYIG